MYRDRVLRKVLRRRLLYDVALELTYQCNLDCFYCGNDRHRQGKPLSIAQYQILLEDLAHMQTLFLMLTGGEPMIHPHFFDIGRMARDFGFVVRVRTNGHTLTPRNIERLINEVDPYLVVVSLHGADAEVHDRQTRVPGSFDRLLGHLRQARATGLRCRLITTPTSWNEHQLDEMLAVSAELDIPLSFQGPVMPKDNGDREPLSIQPSPGTWDRIEVLMKESRALTEKAAGEIRNYNGQSGSNGTSERLKTEITIGPDDLDGPPEAEPPATCSVGLCGAAIDPYGNVMACLNLQESAGNLHQQSIVDIWNHSPLFTRVRQQAIDAAAKWGGDRPRQFGAPLYCLGVEENCAKGYRGCGRS